MRRKPVRWVKIALLVSLACFVVASCVLQAPAGNSRILFGDKRTPEPRLEVSAAKGIFGLQVTNRETETLRRCDVTLREKGRPDEWYAVIPGSLERLETATLSWSQFHASGQSMPPYIGQNATSFTVSCLGSDETRRSAGLAF